MTADARSSASAATQNLRASTPWIAASVAADYKGSWRELSNLVLFIERQDAVKCVEEEEGFFGLRPRSLK